MTEPYQQRVTWERDQLGEKLQKLCVFTDSGNTTFLSLPADEQFRLRLQALAMRQYWLILNERIDHF